MFKSTFVSLYFSSNRLQIVKLSSSKKKVEHFATLDLPEGLIVNHVVQDTRVLATFLKNIWKKLKMKEKSVGIVVPEFSTFIKNLTFPKLEGKELDEAVRWQIQEFLPQKRKQVSMDWRISKRGEDNYKVLVIAIEKSILNGYVEAADLAGLFPMVVETPSLSLVKLAGSDDEGKLMVYDHFDETVLTIVEGERILGSSVVPSERKDEIISTASIIIDHYRQTQVNKILVGGVGIDSSLLNNLKDTFNLPMTKLDVKLVGMKDEDIQTYLVPISLQLQKPERPESEETVNLLPRKVVKKYEEKRFKLQLWSIMMILTFIVALSFLISLGTYIFLTQQINDMKTQNLAKQTAIEETQEARDKIKKINNAAAGVIRVSDSLILPQTAINTIYDAKPEGIQLTDQKYELEKGIIELKGVAATRTDLINFKRSLEEVEELAQVAIPISSFEVESNLDFEMSLIYLESIKR
ncbi:MAG: pilus assembly protein PilM [Candidatus Woesebacteria bacterium]|jgi:type IV pilus assembly protein PilM